MYNPVSTIRLQFQKDFTFSDFEKLISFFVDLGVKTIYASPVFHAVPGSTHGYNITNPLAINPEIGTLQQLKRISATLKQHNIGWLQDIVPNHMAFHQSNAWLWDVMEKGPMSLYRDFFDTALSGDYYQSRLMVPVLPGALEDAIIGGQLKISFSDRLYFEAGDSHFPLNSRSYRYILRGEDAPQNITSFTSQLQDLHVITDAVRYSLRWSELLQEFASLMRDEKSGNFVTQAIDRINKDPSAVSDIAELQFYRLCYWKETATAVNFRRFFTVNELISLNVHRDDVFRQYHQLIAELYREGIFDGVRVDHIDGLYDPAGYLRRLRDLLGPDAYIIVEKILQHDEETDPTFPIQGTTGYEFLAQVNKLFTSRQAEGKLEEFYNSFLRRPLPVEERIVEKKKLILSNYLAGELDNLSRYFIELNLVDQPPSIHIVKNVVAGFLVKCPVYRFYGNSMPLDEEEERQILKFIDDELLRQVLIDKPRLGNKEYNDRALRFYQRLMQFTGPLMAKGVEDTLMYTFNRFIGHNEVGDSPADFSITLSGFHSAMQGRLAKWRLSLNSSATHDTKRGEDVRARLNVITDLAGEWIQLVTGWFAENESEKNGAFIDRNDEYLMYQVIAGSYPHGDNTDYILRLDDYITKALREAKRNSTWEDPAEEYEDNIKAFVKRILSSESAFMKTFLPFEERLSDHGYVNSLGQLVLKMTCPGVPDVYQGSLGWDLSLVDPDNRRPVDYDNHAAALDRSTDLPTLWKNRADGRIKVRLTQELLRLRRDNVSLFTHGRYQPLHVSGRLASHVMAFARAAQGSWTIVAFMFHTAKMNGGHVDLASIDWSDTMITLPDDAPKDVENVLTGETSSHNGRLEVGELFQDLPVSVVMLRSKPTVRSAGVLMPVTSLPSIFPVGDIGPGARAFADFLLEGGQKAWQMLPVNATDKSTGYSPYSSYSSIAGNTLLISPEDLYHDGLLNRAEVAFSKKRIKERIDYDKATDEKNKLLTKAWKTFVQKKPEALTQSFEEFIEKEKDWLHGFSLFELIYRQQDSKPWYEWPDKLRNRDEAELKNIETEFDLELRKIKWFQFIFFRQMKALHEYCRERGIELIGDLPFYVGHYSADVWLYPGLFDIDENSMPNGIAGVPPDYFNADGQLWGMPVYRWEQHKAENYQWWVNRLRSNLAFFDKIRLDHFRAFVSYWTVPDGEKASKGSWQTGPGEDLFKVLRSELRSLPLIAEDLGDVDENVFILRDKLNVPGMKVLQFGFGGDFPSSPHLPHNYGHNFIAYTGTHDNNTMRGWFEHEVTSPENRNLSSYIGRTVTSSNISAEMARLVYSSVADTVIIPIQDVLNLKAKTRINKPSTVSGENWTWRLTKIPGKDVAERLGLWVRTFNR
jgi:malto-oligosyltrehalose synthase/4-alpha-glucanotransferase